jgi:pimeloyl-ACP methyl ester carboxylesterase
MATNLGFLIRLTLAVTLALVSQLSHAQATTCGTDDPAFDDTLLAHPYEADVSPYPLGHWLYTPAGYSSAPCKTYPLLVFLHGLGEKCPGAALSALNKSSLNSPGYQIQQRTAYTDQRPFLEGLILEPQTCDSSWTAASIDAMVEHIKSTHRVDPDRIYVTGLSLGGGGTWTYAAAHPTKVAAIVPIAGTEKALSTIQVASHVPTWAFHNFNDTNFKPDSLNPPTDLFRCHNYTHRLCTIEHIDRMVPFANSYVMAGYSADGGATMAATDRTASLMPGGELLPTQWVWDSSAYPLGLPSTMQFTLFAASGHGGWKEAYAMPQMWQWLYAQRRPPATTLVISSQSISPTTAGVNDGTPVTVTAKVNTPANLAQLWVDLKKLGGTGQVRMSLVSGTSNTYRVTHTLPASGLSAGAKGIGIIAIDTSGRRTIKYVTITLQ